jgi:hypothetical protein
MATFTKFEVFPEHLSGKTHDLFGTSGSTADVCKVALHSDAPVVATDAGLGDVTQPTGTGYTAGGISISNTCTRSGGTVTFTGTDQVWTATAADWTAFRYTLLYNDTPTSPADPVIGDWDYGSSVTLGNGETFTVDFGASIFTMA